MRSDSCQPNILSILWAMPYSEEILISLTFCSIGLCYERFMLHYLLLRKTFLFLSSFCSARPLFLVALCTPSHMTSGALLSKVLLISVVWRHLLDLKRDLFTLSMPLPFSEARTEDSGRKELQRESICGLCPFTTAKLLYIPSMWGVEQKLPQCMVDTLNY